MKRPAAILSLVVAAILLGISFTAWRNDALTAAARTTEEFQALHDGATDVMQEDLAEDQARHTTEGIEAVVGAAFLIAGVALFGASSKRAQPSAEASSL